MRLGNQHSLLSDRHRKKMLDLPDHSGSGKVSVQELILRGLKLDGKQRPVECRDTVDVKHWLKCV